MGDRFFWSDGDVFPRRQSALIWLTLIGSVLHAVSPLFACGCATVDHPEKVDACCCSVPAEPTPKACRHCDSPQSPVDSIAPCECGHLQPQTNDARVVTLTLNNRSPGCVADTTVVTQSKCRLGAESPGAIFSRLESHYAQIALCVWRI